MKKHKSWLLAMMSAAAAVCGAAEEKKATAKPEVGYLGVSAHVIDPADRADLGLKPGQNGLLVIGVAKDGPAAQAGLREGDVLLAIDGKEAATPHAFGEQVRGMKPGTEVNLRVLRDGKEQTLAAVVGAAPLTAQPKDAEEAERMQAQMMAMLPPEIRDKVKALEAKAGKLAAKYKEQGLSEEEARKRIDEELQGEVEEIRKSMGAGR